MTYWVEQKIGKNVYVYEVASYWDSEKKQARQKRRYIGKKDPITGKIITPRKGFTPRKARDYGDVYLLTYLGKRIGLWDVLKEVFPEEYEEIFNLSLYQVIEGDALYLFKGWAEGSYIEEGKIMNSQNISRLLESIGVRDDLVDKFFRLWLDRQQPIKSIVFDITSLSSYSRLIEYLEWGYNRDGEALPQINLGMIVGYPSEIPIAYRIYPGSIPDVVTLKNVIVFLEELGLKEFLFVLDRGFYSASNIKELNEKGIGFLLPLSWRTKIARGLISRYHRELLSPINGFYWEKKAMFHTKKEIEIWGLSLCAHLFHDERRKAEEVEKFMRRMVEIEKSVSEMEFRDRKAVEEFIDENLKGGVKIFNIKGKAPFFQLERRAKVISRLMNRMGKTILLSNQKGLGREEVLSFYRKKDTLEKMFDVIKNELDSKRLKIHSRARMEGRIFLTFLALILYSEIHRIMREKDLYKTYTIPEVFLELKKLKVVTLSNGKSYLTEISKKQRLLFEKFGVPPPVST